MCRCTTAAPLHVPSPRGPSPGFGRDGGRSLVVRGPQHTHPKSNIVQTKFAVEFCKLESGAWSWTRSWIHPWIAPFSGQCWLWNCVSMLCSFCFTHTWVWSLPALTWNRALCVCLLQVQGRFQRRVQGSCLPLNGAICVQSLWWGQGQIPEGGVPCSSMGPLTPERILFCCFAALSFSCRHKRQISSFVWSHHSWVAPLKSWIHPCTVCVNLTGCVDSDLLAHLAWKEATIVVVWMRLFLRNAPHLISMQNHKPRIWVFAGGFDTGDGETAQVRNNNTRHTRGTSQPPET